MNKRIKELTEQLDRTLVLQKDKVESLTDALQTEYNKVFNDSKELEKIIINASSSSEYQLGCDGDIESWFRFYGLRDYQECREYFEAWLQDAHCMRVDWDNDCLVVSHGDDNLIIQTESRRNNGVYQSGKCVIEESQYRNDDNEIDEEKRNALIEAHMERTGCFPGVFRMDYHGNVFPVNTRKKGVQS